MQIHIFHKIQINTTMKKNSNSTESDLQLLQKVKCF